MACHLLYDDSPMTAVQIFNYIRHRYPDIGAYYRGDREIVVIPEAEGIEEAVMSIRELAVRKGLNCSEVCAAWPEYLGQEILDASGASNFLVIAEIKGKYSQLR
ncbi:hypothetical protein [Methanocella arvoryzae]|uniref:Uncharacterized protein n=1 Tax=Methanocella arvoryzae (strain DSM 22066 / NBRC 105507 / MRE50) TaxID=351160 RepID=Q0W1S8_METAR|nr:hypothetical protein [Methanocella arvoryzae]CAJ37665.1 hypothetical protein RCIX2616 [Methanocella arvoryzae MRE50]